MANECACPTCGGRIARSEGNVVFLRQDRDCGPPRLDALELPDGSVRLNVNLVVSRAVAIRVLACLEDDEE